MLNLYASQGQGSMCFNNLQAREFVSDIATSETVEH